MTKQEAIETIKLALSQVEWDYPLDYAAAFDMAISALEQPEIIHCKDCKHAHITYSGEVKYCDIWFPDESHYMDTDNFCSFAERREEC